MVSSNKKTWFSPLSSTWFWKPVTWKGWITLLFYYSLLLGILWLTLDQPHTTKKLILNTAGGWLAATAVLYGVIFKTSTQR